MDFLDPRDGQNVARGLAAEFVCAVAGADGNGQSVQSGGFDELRGFLGVGQHLAVVKFAHRANAVFFARVSGFQIAQATQFPLDRHANQVRHVDHASGHVHVVRKVSGGFAIFQQRAVHHDG